METVKIGLASIMLAIASPFISVGFGVVKGLRTGGDMGPFVMFVSALSALAILSTIAFVVALVGLLKDAKKWAAIVGGLLSLAGMALTFPQIAKGPWVLTTLWQW